MRLVFASNNPHKLQEVREILTSCTIISLKEIGFTEEIEETGETLEANSLIKAQTINKWMREKSIKADGIFADDTGLEIAALNGKPGVRTARWAGEPVSEINNRKKAITELLGKTQRDAQFRTVITLIRGDKIEQVEGIVHGVIAEQEYGNGGFGYDPLFIPEGYTKTFSELPSSVKNQVSHRARAIETLKKLLFA